MIVQDRKAPSHQFITEYLFESLCPFIWNYTAPSALDLKRFFSRLVFWNLFIEKLRSLSPCVFSSFHYLLMSASCLFLLCPNCITHLPPGAHCLEGETSPQLWRLSWVFISVCVFEWIPVFFSVYSWPYFYVSFTGNTFFYVRRWEKTLWSPLSRMKTLLLFKAGCTPEHSLCDISVCDLSDDVYRFPL